MPESRYLFADALLSVISLSSTTLASRGIQKSIYHFTLLLPRYLQILVSVMHRGTDWTQTQCHRMAIAQIPILKAHPTHAGSSRCN